MPFPFCSNNYTDEIICPFTAVNINKVENSETVFVKVNINTCM